jgi:transcriptional regulator with XRE-family HTH domain
MMRGSLAERLRVLRAQEGLTLNEASVKIGVNRHTLRDLELGKREPYGPTIRKIAEAYNVPLAQLLEEQPLVPLDEARKGERGQPQPSPGTVEEFQQKLARVMAPARAEALRDEQAANRFFASEGIERDYSGPIAEAEVWERFLDEFSPEERAKAFGEVVDGYALLERLNMNLEASLSRAEGFIRDLEASLREAQGFIRGIAELEEEIARLRQENAQLRAEAERRGVRD